MTARDELAEDEAIIAGATAGPWVWEDDTLMAPNAPQDYDSYGGQNSIIETDSGAYPPHENDRAFISRARTRWPALVAEVKELRKRILAADAALARLWACNHGDETMCGCRKPADNYFNSLPGPARHEEVA